MAGLPSGNGQSSNAMDIQGCKTGEFEARGAQHCVFTTQVVCLDICEKVNSCYDRTNKHTDKPSGGYGCLRPWPW